MTIEIKAPTFPESVADGTVATWHKQPGEAVNRDELIVDIETDKVVLEIVAPSDGVISEIIKGEGELVLSDEIIGMFAAGEGSVGAPEPAVETQTSASKDVDDVKLSPAARKMAAESNKQLMDQIDRL